MNKGFKLYFIDNSGVEILISDYVNSKNVLTFNESIVEEENSKYTLNFEIFKNYDRVEYLDLTKFLRIGRKLKLELFGPNKTILFIITSISPESTEENIKWVVSAEDYASYIFNKNNIGLHLDTIEDEDFNEWFEEKTNRIITVDNGIHEGEFISNFSLFLNENLLEEKIDYTYTTEEKELTINFISPVIGPEEVIIKRNVIAKDIMQYVLERGYLYNDSDEYKSWTIVDNESLTLENNPLYQQINISISDSNTYNALVETALLTKSFLVINYNSKEIGLIRKNDESFRKNYLLSPNFNLQDFSLNYNSESFYPILYVTGGSDEFDIAVTMMPYLTFQQYKDLYNFFNGSREITKIVDVAGDYSFDIFNIRDDTTPTVRVNDFVIGEDDWGITGNTGNIVTVYNLALNDVIRFAYESDTLPNFDPSLISTYYEDPNFYEEVDWYREPEDDTISILNYLVYLDSFIINLDYFKKNYLINDSDFNNIIDRIYNGLREINWEYQQLIHKKNTFEKYIYDIESKLENYTDRLVLNETTDYRELNNEINSIYLKEGGYEAQSTPQSNEITSTAIFANTGKTYKWIAQWGNIFYQVERAIYEELRDLEETPRYELWIDGNPVYNKMIYKDEDNDIYYVSTPIKSSAAPYVIDLDLPEQDQIYEDIIINSKNEVYKFDGNLNFANSTGNYKYKFTVNISENLKNFNQGLISTTLYRNEYSRIWKDNSSSLGTMSFSTPTSSPYPTNIVEIDEAPQKSLYPTVKNWSVYNGASQINFPDTNYSVGSFYGKYAKETSKVVSNTSGIIQMKKYIHHGNGLTYFMVLRQISSDTAALDIYNENLTDLIDSKNYSVPVSDGDFIEFQITEKVRFGRYIVISHEWGIWIWDISDDTIASWGTSPEMSYIFGQKYQTSFIVKSHFHLVLRGYEVYFQQGIFLINASNQAVFLSKSSDDENFIVGSHKDLSGTYYDIEYWNNKIYLAKSVSNTYSIVSYDFNDIATAVEVTLDTSTTYRITKIHYHYTHDRKPVLFYNKRFDADLGAINLNNGLKWTSNYTLGNSGYVKDIVIENDMLYAYAIYEHNTNKKDRALVYNIEYGFSTVPTWAQDPLYYYEQPLGTFKTVSALSKMDYSDASISYDNYMICGRNSTPNFILKELYNYPMPSSLPNFVGYPLVYFNQYTNQKGYKITSWDINEDNYNTPITSYSFVLKKQNLLYNTQYVDLLYVSMNYFDLLRQYKGTNYLLEKEKKLKKQLIDAIKEKDKILEEISLISDEDPDKLNLALELEAYRAGVGTWIYNKGTDTFGYEENTQQDGKYSVLYSNFKYYREYYDSSTVFANVTYENSVYGNYERVKKDKEKFWFNIKRDYGEFLQEGFYENEIESNSFNLYKQGIQNITDFNHPTEEYSLTYLDGSDLLGANIDLIQVGDFIKINLENLGVMDEERNEVQVYSIQRELRDLSNISLTVGKVNRNTTLVEKIIASLNKK